MRRLLLMLLVLVPGSLALPLQTRRAGVPEPVLPATDALPSPSRFAELMRTNPVAALQACVLRYKREVHGFRSVLHKRERIAGKLGPEEEIDVSFRDEPYSVLLSWRTPGAGLADRALYVDGQNDNQLLARPRNALLRRLSPVAKQDPDGAQARASGRYSIRDFGLLKATERSLAAWESAQRHGRLRYEYAGERAVPEAGGVVCHVLRRTIEPPEDGVTRTEVSFDVVRWLQVANVLYGSDGPLVAHYFFRDVILNPTFPSDQFDPSALTRD
ncbi:MAG: DUF1571 domain-containing protein [Gemmataceae bacterium]